LIYCEKVKMMQPICMLLDNGSLRPQPTLRLRSIAEKLSLASGVRVEPVSILHSDRVSPIKLNGESAQVAAAFIDKAIAAGQRRFVCLPLFIGPSLALTEYLPMLFEQRRGNCPDLCYSIAAPLAGEDPEAIDARMVAALVERVDAVMQVNRWQHPAVALVDHGTPVAAVNRVRESMAKALAEHFCRRGMAVKGFAMERKPGAAYAFNEPMLEAIRSVAGFEKGPIVVAMFFLLEGRHAGAEGDVAGICADVCARYPDAGPIAMTDLLGSSDWLVPLLLDRLKACLEQALNH
jgi:sirohydrochlorin ferrochelatase